MNNYTNFLAMVSTEFQKYVMEHEAIADKIPLNALIIFQVEGDDDFNNWHKNISMRNREGGQPIIYIYVKKWRKHSSIEELKVAAVA